MEHLFNRIHFLLDYAELLRMPMAEQKLQNLKFLFIVKLIFTQQKIELFIDLVVYV